MFRVINGIPFVFLHMEDADWNDRLRRFALDQESAIVKLPTTDAWENIADRHTTTSRYASYNSFLLDPELTRPLYRLVCQGYEMLRQATDSPPTPKMVGSWINLHREGHHLHRHTHHYPFVAYYAVHAKGSATIYGGKHPGEGDVRIENVNGQLVVTLGKPVYHEVTPWKGPDVRVTIACDIADLETGIENRVFVPLDGKGDSLARI